MSTTENVGVIVQEPGANQTIQSRIGRSGKRRLRKASELAAVVRPRKEGGDEEVKDRRTR